MQIGQSTGHPVGQTKSRRSCDFDRESTRGPSGRKKSRNSARKNRYQRTRTRRASRAAAFQTAGRAAGGGRGPAGTGHSLRADALAASQESSVRRQPSSHLPPRRRCCSGRCSSPPAARLARDIVRGSGRPPSEVRPGDAGCGCRGRVARGRGVDGAAPTGRSLRARRHF